MTGQGTQLKGLLRIVFFQPDVTGAGMSFHAFKARNSGGNLPYSSTGALRKTLVGHSFDELTDAQTP
jgi:hypothetical protein